MNFEELKYEYERLFKQAVISASSTEIQLVTNRIVTNKERYLKIQGKTNVPWYLVGIIHNLEASGNFACHLHNGDSLSGRTVQVPSGRPKKGNPPFTWEESAVDAIKYDGLHKWKDWSIPGILYCLEKYNGWGYRLYHPEVKSPYLWSGTSVYIKGKYVADGKFDSNAVSQQIGVAAILKELENRGEISATQTYRTATWIELFPSKKPVMAAWQGSEPEPVEVISSNSTKDLITFLKDHGSGARTFLIAQPTKPIPKLATRKFPEQNSQETEGNENFLSKVSNFPVTIRDAVKRQIDRLEKYVKVSNINLDTKTKFFSQRDNYTMPHRTCNSSANAMYLDWLLRVTGTGDGLETDDGYLKTVLQYADTIYHHAQTSAIKHYGFKTKWMTDEDLLFIEALIDCGFPVVVNILHRGPQSAPRGGHIILLIGRKEGQWIAHDPYGTLESGYSNTNGQFSRISESEFSNRWQGGYRILA